MLYSLLVKLAMLAVTMGAVFWIGWTVPQSRTGDADRIAEAQADGDIRNEPVLSSVADMTEGPRATAPSSERVRDSRQSGIGELDLNTATEQELETLPGIGPVLAERIVEYRQARGGFREVAQLRQVKGIGKKKFDRIRAKVRVMPAAARTRGDRKAT